MTIRSITRVCVICGENYSRTRARGETCSPACRGALRRSRAHLEFPNGRKSDDITGQRFGYLKVLGYAGSRMNGSVARGFWKCLCEACGKETQIRSDALKDGKCITCGCGGHELSGRRFGRLLVVKHTGSSRYHQREWYCLCDCGTFSTVKAASLLGGTTKSCGCLRLEGRRPAAGRINAHRTSKVYTAWRNMKGRCYKPENRMFRHYGARGITVCDTWSSSFDAFLADVGQPPHPGLTLERLDPDKNYEPGNVVWATGMVQAMNKRMFAAEFADFKDGLRALCGRAGVSFDDVFSGFLIGQLSTRLA